MQIMIDFFFFFFSSRRRHTRFDCDWSSDVCSSDLLKLVRGINDRLDQLQIEPAAMPLVSNCRIIKAIAQNDFSCSQRWPDNFPDELRAAGVHQKELRFRCHGLILSAMFESVAYFFADRRPARLANCADDMASLAQPFCQQPNLSGFAPAFGSFEGDEEALGHVKGLCGQHAKMS